jgi:hypothetical protein
LVFVIFVKIFNVDLETDPKPKIAAMVKFCYGFMLFSLSVVVFPVIIMMTLPRDFVSFVYTFMFGSPVAFVLGCVHDTKVEDTNWEAACQYNDPNANEWLINIGGVVLRQGHPIVPPAPGVSIPAALPTSPAAEPTSGASPAAGSPSPGPPPPLLQAIPWPDAYLDSPYWNFPTAIIHRGLTVPFYFVLISLFGASISLIRKVPQYQAQIIKDANSAAVVREGLVLQVLQFPTAPLIAIIAYEMITPAGPTTSIPLAFAAGFSSESVLALIGSGLERLKSVGAPSTSGQP